MDESAIKAIGSLAIQAAAANRVQLHTPAIFSPEQGGLINLESLMEGRARFRGTYKTPFLSEFATYVKAHQGGEGFIDAKACTATTFFNLGTQDKPGHADWRAVLSLEPTAAYAAIKGIDGRAQSQRQIVEWCEDWAPQLSARFSDDADSSISTALIALRKLTISIKSDATHTDRDFGASKTKLEDVEAKGDNGLPTHIVVATEPYAGFGKRDFALRLSVITGDKPALVLRFISREQTEESIAQEFKAKLLEAIGDAATMTIGSFAP